jgi:hypothetical protein
MTFCASFNSAQNHLKNMKNSQTTAARLKIIPKTPPSAFGYSIVEFGFSTEPAGDLLLINLTTSDGKVELRCHPDWAIKLAARIKQCAEERIRESKTAIPAERAE